MSINTSTPEKARLTRIKITKFRAIGSAEIELSDTVALVGQNGSGKTSILRALNAFFNFSTEEPDFNEGRHKFKNGTTTVIEVTMTGLQDSGLPLSDAATGEVRAELKFRSRASWRVWTSGAWIAMPGDFHARLRDHISFVMIPIRRDHEVAHDPSEGLLERAVEQWVSANHQRDRRSPQIVRVAADLRSRSLSGLERHLQRIAPMSGAFSFELDYSTPPDYRLLLQNLRLSVKEGGQLIQLADSGSGTQSMAVFALYAYLAELENTNYVLGLEEPEQNLHPQAQQQLMRNLQMLGIQVVFTTHSPTIVDALQHENVVLCRRFTSTGRELEVRVTQVPSTFFATHDLDRDAYYKFHERRNSDFLFADFVIVTESPIDSAVVEQLLDESGHPLEDLGATAVSLDGVVSLPFMFSLLKELQIPAAYVVDKDYLVPYRGTGERNASLNAKGYPSYSPSMKNRSIIPTLFPKQKDQQNLLIALTSNHTAAMDMLQEVNFFCFRYALEIDLVTAPTTRQKLFDLANLRDQYRTESTLLKERRKVLKDQATLLQAFSGVPAPNLPNSYKRLRSQLPVLAKAARSI